MANLDYFATRADHEAVIRFLFDSMDVRLFELDSKYGQELREFRSYEELIPALDEGAVTGGKAFDVLLGIASTSVAEFSIERIALDPRRCKGHTYRYNIVGRGLMSLYLGGVHARIITKSHFGHHTEAGARKWGFHEGVDWVAFRRLSKKIQYYIRHRLAKARVWGRPVLPDAFECARSGYALMDSLTSATVYQLPEGE